MSGSAGRSGPAGLCLCAAFLRNFYDFAASHNTQALRFSHPQGRGVTRGQGGFGDGCADSRGGCCLDGGRMRRRAEHDGYVHVRCASADGRGRSGLQRRLDHGRHRKPDTGLELPQQRRIALPEPVLPPSNDFSFSGLETPEQFCPIVCNASQPDLGFGESLNAGRRRPGQPRSSRRCSTETTSRCSATRRARPSPPSR